MNPSPIQHLYLLFMADVYSFLATPLLIYILWSARFDKASFGSYEICLFDVMLFPILEKTCSRPLKGISWIYVSR